MNLKDQVQTQDRNELEKELKVKSEGYGENVIKGMILDKTESIYKHLNINDMKIVNLGGA